MHAVVERQSPHTAGHPPVIARRPFASLPGAFRRFTRRLGMRIPGTQPEYASAPPSSQVLCRLQDVPDGGVIGADPRCQPGLPLILRRQGDRVQAWLNICPHDGRRMNSAPGLFHVDGGLLRCAVRGAQFALARDGLCISGPCRGRSLVAVPVQVRGGLVTMVEGTTWNQTRDVTVTRPAASAAAPGRGG
jgi:nitrite reductase/ring-hydroxylating ferredoxin subunit